MLMANCLICDKTTVLGRTHTHHRGVAGGRWKKRAQKVNRLFKANLQNVTLNWEGEQVKAKLCTKCIKRAKKDVADGVTPLVSLVS